MVSNGSFTFNTKENPASEMPLAVEHGSMTTLAVECTSTGAVALAAAKASNRTWASAFPRNR